MFKKLFYVILLLTLMAVPSQAQTSGNTEEVDSQPSAPPQYFFFLAPVGEVNMYGWDVAFGGGLSIGGGDSITMGANILYFADSYKINVLEITIFIRYFILGSEKNYGPFFQLVGGMTIFGREDFAPIPSGIGSMSGGAAFGWRFMLGKRWFVEPAIRAGYPYLVGVGVSTGLLF